MAEVQACLLTFDFPTIGPGTQTITGVVDEDGAPFIPKVFLFQSGLAALDTVVSGPIGDNSYATYLGVDTGAIRSGNAIPDAFSVFGFKVASGGTSFGDYSILDGFVSNFAQFFFMRMAKISAVRSGEFDITYDQNARTGDSCQVLALGGDGLDLAFTNYVIGTYACPSKPQGILGLPSLPPPAASGPTTWGTGGSNVPWGFATRDGVYGTSDSVVVNLASNFCVQRTDAWTCEINQSSAALGGLSTVSAWGDTSFSIGTNGAGTSIPMVICGENVRTAGGMLTEGDTVVEMGIHARVVLFFSVGRPADTAVSTPVAQIISGWATPSTQLGYWTGEQTIATTPPIQGARYMATDSVFRAGTPDALSTTFDAICQVVSIGADGRLTLTWPTSDAGDRQVLWFAIGEALAPTPPAPTPVYRTREVVRRRLRRAPIVWSEKGGLQTRVRVNLFAVDMQPGVGTADTPDPLVMIRCSKDGGFTWGNERRVSAGRIGEYFDRINTWRWGQGREWVFEVACTDPVTWNLVQVLIDAEDGES